MDKSWASAAKPRTPLVVLADWMEGPAGFFGKSLEVGSAVAARVQAVVHTAYWLDCSRDRGVLTEADIKAARAVLVAEAARLAQIVSTPVKFPIRIQEAPVDKETES